MHTNMSLMDAVYHAVHDAPGGVASLAPRLGKAPSTLSAEIRPQVLGTAKMGLIDAMKIAQLTGDMRIPTAFAANVGMVLVPLPETVCSDSDDSAMMRMASVAKEFGDMCAAFSIAMADGRVSANELAKFDRESGELMAALHSLRVSISRIHTDGQPARSY